MKKKPAKKTKQAKKITKPKAIRKKTAPIITKDTVIGDIVRQHPELASVFLEHGLHCVGCAIAQFDTIEAGARAHGIHPEYLLKDLNAKLKKKKK